MPRISRIVGQENISPAVPSPELVLDNSYTGLEVEIENVQSGRVPNSMSQWWRSIEDGSLRNGGREFVLREPTLGENLSDAMTALYNNWNSNWSISDRCSFHVHVDIRDLNVDQYYLLRLYSLALDDYLFSFSPERYSNSFARSSSRSFSHIDSMKYMGTRDVGDWTTDRVTMYESNCKYVSVNVRATRQFGSIEYRHFQVPPSREAMLEIINTLLTIKKCAMDTATEDLSTDLAYGISQLSHSAILEAFPEQANSINKHLQLIRVL